MAGAQEGFYLDFAKHWSFGPWRVETALLYFRHASTSPLLPIRALRQALECSWRLGREA